MLKIGRTTVPLAGLLATVVSIGALAATPASALHVAKVSMGGSFQDAGGAVFNIAPGFQFAIDGVFHNYGITGSDGRRFQFQVKATDSGRVDYFNDGISEWVDIEYSKTILGFAPYGPSFIVFDGHDSAGANVMIDAATADGSLNNWVPTPSSAVASRS